MGGGVYNLGKFWGNPLETPGSFSLVVFLQLVGIPSGPLGSSGKGLVVCVKQFLLKRHTLTPQITNIFPVSLFFLLLFPPPQCWTFDWQSTMHRNGVWTMCVDKPENSWILLRNKEAHATEVIWSIFWNPITCSFQIFSPPKMLPKWHLVDVFGGNFFFGSLHLALCTGPNLAHFGFATARWGFWLLLLPRAKEIRKEINPDWVFLFQTSNILKPHHFGRLWQMRSLVQVRDAICIFYLVLRGLDTIEDDMSVPLDVKVPELLAFFERLDQPGVAPWNKVV